MKVFIVEDSELMLEHLQFMLSEIPGTVLVGHAVDENGAIEKIEALQPEVVILDLSLQSGSGIGVLENIKRRNPALKVMVFTNFTDDFYVKRCMQAGADYFFDKSFQFMRVRAVLWQWLNNGSQDNKLASLPQ